MPFLLPPLPLPQPVAATAAPATACTYSADVAATVTIAANTMAAVWLGPRGPNVAETSNNQFVMLYAACETERCFSLFLF